MKIIKPGFRIVAPTGDGWTVAAKRIERMGRIAYKSEDKISRNSWQSFIKMIVKRGHEAVLEHATMAVIFTCDRGISHEIVRHRLCAFTQESTRYCNYSNRKFNNELTFIEPLWEKWEEGAKQDWHEAVQQAENSYISMVSHSGVVAPQDARSVLPNSLKTEIGVTANFREWRHIFSLRAISKAAHPQMRELMIPLYEICRLELPEVFDMGDVE